MEKFFIVKEALKKVKRFNLTGRTLEFKINPIPTGKEPVSWIKEAINEVIQRGTDGLAPEDQVSRDDIWDMISGVYQSNSTGFSTETFCLGVTSVKMPAGKGRGRLYNSFDEECNMRRGIIVINNKDNMCLPRALVVAIAYVNKDKDQTKKELVSLNYNSFNNTYTNIRSLYMDMVGRAVKSYLADPEKGPKLNLIYHEGHYNAITSLTAAFKCGFRLIVHREDVIGSFMKYLTEVRKKFKQVIVIAHNGKAFDHQFILNYILVNTDLNPELIMRGTKIISMKMENVKFLDSLNYFPMALSKLPKAFGLGDGFKKAYFPHLFNTIDNSNYVGPLPPLEFYSPDNIKPEERDKFLEWYEAHKQDEFNMQRDLVEYCISDVEILTAACLKFREQLLDTGNVCPFTEACTIASACNKVYRRNFLQPNTIGIIPRGGYRWKDNQSKIAIQWLLWLERTREINILHAGKGKESVVHGVKVDGFCPNIKEIFEFHGCYFHGCEKCFRQGRDVPLHDNQDETMNSRRESTNIRMERLRDFGYTITEIWECEFRKMLKDNGELKTFLENHAFPPNPLNPRDCFYGGRTGNTVEYYKCKAGEKIKYVDVCSLYPWEECTHTDEQRALTGTWVIDEVNKALTLCYELMKIHEIWNYQVDQFNTVTKAGGLFTDMMNKFIKVKQQASGWPNNCSTQEQKDRYIEEFLTRENRENQPKTKIVRDPSEFFGMLIDPGIFVNSALPINEDTLVVNWEQKEEAYDILSTVNVVIAAYVTTQARLKLYSYLERLGDRVLYYDTDSVIYVSKEGEYEPETGNFIGDLTDELEIYGKGCYITEFVPGVPKNYAYKVYSVRDKEEKVTTPHAIVLAAHYTQGRKLRGKKILYQLEEGEYEPETGNFIGDLTDELEIYGKGCYITEFVSGGPKNYAYKVYSVRDKEEKV
ncbi:hypothetical protein NQ318_018375, partial [Aromia moschata]